MSANVETMFYTREKPWHGLGTMVMEAPTSAEALALAGLDWNVIQKPVVTEDGIPIPGFKANLRDTDKKVLGIEMCIRDRYTSLKCKLESGKGRKDFIDEIVKHEPDFMEMHKHGFASQYEFDSFRKRPNARESSEGEEWSKTRKSVLNRLNKVKIENFPDAFSIPTPELYYYLNPVSYTHLFSHRHLS